MFRPGGNPLEPCGAQASRSIETGAIGRFGTRTVPNAVLETRREHFPADSFSTKLSHS